MLKIEDSGFHFGAAFSQQIAAHQLLAHQDAVGIVINALYGVEGGIKIAPDQK